MSRRGWSVNSVYAGTPDGADGFRAAAGMRKCTHRYLGQVHSLAGIHPDQLFRFQWLLN